MDRSASAMRGEFGKRGSRVVALAAAERAPEDPDIAVDFENAAAAGFCEMLRTAALAVAMSTMAMQARIKLRISNLLGFSN